MRTFIIGLIALFLHVNLFAQCDDADDLPTATVTATPVGCGGGSVTLTFDFDDDDEEHDVIWRIGSVVQPALDGVESGHQETINVTSNTTITIVTVTEEDDADCTANVNFVLNITLPTGATLALPTLVQPTCGSTNGSITINATGGATPLSYRLNAGAFQPSNIFSGLASGSYTITVRDASGCEATQTASLNASGAPTLALPTLVQPTCGSTNGSITINATGGATPLSYRLNAGTFQPSNIFSGLASDSYTITVRDASGCEASQTASLDASGVPTLAAPSIRQPACGIANGRITVNATGGLAPLSFRLNSGEFQTIDSFPNLPSGSYTITVRDASSCEANQTVTLNAIDGPVLAAPTVVQPSCNASNGAITMNVTGSTPITYRINAGAFQASPIFPSLASGSYTLTARDGNICEGIQIVNLVASDDDLPTARVSASPIPCGGGNVTFTFEFGADDDDDATYDVIWTIGGIPQAPLNNITTGHQELRQLTTNTSVRIVTVTESDDDECTADVNFVLAVSVPQSPTLLEPTLTLPTCGATNGAIRVNAAGASPVLTYRLDMGNFQSSPIFSALTSGGYTIAARDTNGCESTQSVSLAAANGPSLAAPTLSLPSCGGTNGSITVNASGGTPPLSYQIGSGAFQTTVLFSGLASGSYTVTVRDANSCTSSITVSVANTGFTLSSPGVVQPSCGGAGQVTLSPVGGTAPFTFSLDGVTFQNTPNFTNLSAGSYTFICRDAAGCSASLQITLTNPTVNLPPAQISSSGGGSGSGIDTTICAGEQITLTGNLPTGTTGRWTASNANVVFGSPNAPTTTVRFTQSGRVVVTWTLSTPTCPNFSAGTLSFNASAAPNAVDDLSLVATERTVLTVDLSKNDEPKIGNWRTLLVESPRNGLAQLTPNGLLNYTPNANASGLDSMRYAICTDACANLCDTAKVVVRNRDLCDLTAAKDILPQGITPNGDGDNEQLKFQIIDRNTCPFNFTRNDIQIFNRWGDKVFVKEQYENDWDGRTNEGRELPVGVYYYVLRIKLSKPDKPYVKFGSITIFR